MNYILPYLTYIMMMHGSKFYPKQWTNFLNCLFNLMKFRIIHVTYEVTVPYIYKQCTFSNQFITEISIVANCTIDIYFIFNVISEVRHGHSCMNCFGDIFVFICINRTKGWHMAIFIQPFTTLTICNNLQYFTRTIACSTHISD